MNLAIIAAQKCRWKRAPIGHLVRTFDLAPFISAQLSGSVSRLKTHLGARAHSFSKIPNFFTERRSNFVTSSGKVPETWRRNVHAVSAFEIQPRGYFLHELAHFDHLNPSFLLSPSEIRTVFRNGKSKVKVANGIGIPDA
jgi:hypothetical protein